MTATLQVRQRLLGLAVVAGLLFYGFALDGALLFDDASNITQNALVQIDGRVADDWRTAAVSSDAGPLRRPIAMLSFATNHAWFDGFSPVSLKAVNLAIHLFSAMLIYWLALGVFRAPMLRQTDETAVRWSALLAAAIWFLHPFHVSTVLYAVQRMAQLSALFTILGLVVFVHYRLRWAQHGASFGDIAAAFLWLLLITSLATLSKENGALLPWLIAVVEFTLFAGYWGGKIRPAVLWLGRAAIVIPLLFLALILLLAPETFTAGYAHRDFSMTERLMTQSRLLWQYAAWLVLPDITSMGFQHDDISLSQGLLNPWTTLLAIVSAVLVLGASLVMRRRYPMVLFTLLFFLVGHFMESSFLALEMVFEHRNYLPSVAVCLLIGYWLGTPGANWASQVDRRLPVFGIISVLLISLFIRTQSWSGEMSLARSNVAHHPKSSRAHYFYGHALMNQFYRLSSEQADTRKALMVAAREQFLLMHQVAPEDPAALIMLYYLDSYFFSTLEHQHWLVSFKEVMTERVLQASDIAGLNLLLDCIEQGPCLDGAAVTEALLNELIQRNPGEVRLLLAKYKYLAALNPPSVERKAVLAKALSMAPSHAGIGYYAVLEAGEEGDVGAMYSIVQRWLLHDPQRRDLPIIKGMFGPLESLE